MAQTTFGPFVFDRESAALSREGKTVVLGGRGAALLGVLLDADGAVVGKTELMAKVWPGQIVEDGNLTVQMTGLRKALGTRADGSDWIVTVPRVGYRLLKLGSEVPHPAAGSMPSLAVLPFQNLSGDPEQEYFADGIVEDLTTALSRFHAFAVISRNSSFVYKNRAVDVRQIAKELGVRYVLEGSVRRAGNRLRITARLSDGGSAEQLWSQSFDGSTEDVFDVQDRITESVATIVEPQIREAEIERSRRERPESLAAYDLYLRALPKFRAVTESENAAAYQLLEKGIALEPNDAAILAQAANVLQHRYNMGWRSLTADDRAQCVLLASRALASAPDDPTVLAKCGNALLQVNREYDRGFAMLRRAVELNPNHTEVLTYAGIAAMHVGSLDDALGYFSRTLRLSPGDPYAFVPLTGVAGVLLMQGKPGEALAAAERSLAVLSSFDPTYWVLIAANAYLGHMDEARDLTAKLRELVPGITIARIRAAQPDKDPTRMASILEGLRLGGLPED